MPVRAPLARGTEQCESVPGRAASFGQWTAQGCRRDVTSHGVLAL